LQILLTLANLLPRMPVLPFRETVPPPHRKDIDEQQSSGTGN